ncbi:MAG TPA: TIGR00375 family protein [Thermococcaceae archaeon]|uniref:Phosphohydrolase, PHP family n=2 Tax=Thermococcus sibiricus TaxID=172049 RepID=C6A1Z8_THESM|nr:TIGR00375 family protein [Thermococcus sibiricus]ACS89643.1 Phosphohydrolase, PHP family [Thermococcus sibiricus MM 739]KUK17298.1 MAG: Phosphohydrolase, PHP family [Thermococcus sibiricus]KUK28352.1 MAG: Phosphohydrolase, PHP family [Thermococcus sp. 40_45]HII67954.1 TIGR00375 family protein [Thermococcaceae archaeon]
MFIDADLHIHSRYSKAVSKLMTFPILAENAKLKGLGIVGTGDILNPKWEGELLKYSQKVDEGTYEIKGIKFLLTAEVEDNKRVHHLLIFPNIETVRELRERLKHYSKDVESEGRPHLSLNASEIADLSNEFDVLIGPSHAFTPWTALYKEYNSIKEAYGNYKIHFLELGLSADSYMADKIKAHHNLVYLSNSDAHSPQPHRLGREFNRFEVEDATFEEIKKAILKRGGRKIVLNAGLDPRLGKYHLTACSRCYTKYRLEDAKRLGWRCELCGGVIKKGVHDRILELADTDERPKDRPPYLHLAPLAEIIAMVLNKGVETKSVKSIWERLLKEFGSEIRVLVDAPVEAIAELIGDEIAKAIWAFRNEKLIIVPGGGGKYGEIKLPEEVKRARLEDLESIEVKGVEVYYRPKQSSLLSFIKRD